METRILKELRAFLRKHRMPVLTLAQLSGVPQSSLSRLLSGARHDLASRNADALRDFMRHYESTYRQSGGED